LLAKKRVYSTCEIDDLVLGRLEDLGALEADERNLISFDLIYDFFSWYIRRTWGNEEIRRYVHGARTEREEAGDLYKRRSLPYARLQPLSWHASQPFEQVIRVNDIM
jgi:hypothetical protein